MLIRLTKANFRFTFNGLIITGEENTVFSSEGQEQIYHQIIEDQKLRELLKERLLFLSSGSVDWDTDILAAVIDELNELSEKSKK